MHRTPYDTAPLTINKPHFSSNLILVHYTNFLSLISVTKKLVLVCMAAGNLQNRGLVSLGKRFVAQIRTESVIIPSLSLRRSVHGSVYDKNPEDHVHSTVVSDHVIDNQPDWSPHPKTGVFGPGTDHSGADRGFHASASEDTVLEQKAFFRPLEDLDKPEQA